MIKLKYPLPYYIRTALNLEPWDEFAKNQINKNKKFINQWSSYLQGDEVDRGIGTTTKMLVQAVYWSQTKKVYLKGNTSDHTRILVNEAKKMCMKLNLPIENIYSAPNSTRGYGNIFILKDHYCK